MVSAFMPVFSDGASGDAKALRNVVVAYVGWRFSDRGDLVGMQRRSADAFARTADGFDDAL
jgi:hypothetical protein